MPPDPDRPIRLGPPLPRWRRVLQRWRRSAVDLVGEIDIGEAIAWLIRLIVERF